MSHDPGCEESTSTRCRCSCAGHSHGRIGAPFYRSMGESYRSSGVFTPSVKFADAAFDVVAEVIKQAPDGGQPLYNAVQAVVGENAWELLAPKVPRGRRVRKNHWLCQVLAEAADGLDQLGAIGMPRARAAWTPAGDDCAVRRPGSQLVSSRT